MKTFLKMLLASILGGIILFFLFFVMIASLASLAEQETIIDKVSILHLNMDNVIVERADNNPFSALNPLGDMENALGLDEILASIHQAADDERIIGIFLEGGIPLTGHASLREIREALLKFRESGKFVYHYSEILTQKGYYLASAADSIFVNPEGFMEWKGLNATVTYYRDALDKLGLQPEVLRASDNKYKSAVEPFLRQDMSSENREQLSSLLKNLWSTYVSEIALNSSLGEAELDSLANTLAFAGPREAAKHGMIRTAYKDQLLRRFQDLTDKEKPEDLPLLSIQRYADAVSLGEGGYSTDKIAVIIAQGDIVNGEGSEYTIGGERISEAIRKARYNDKVKAIVLRINSPGGSALASESIWREVALARESKPVIASMGDLAASGGYYIACYADTIVAQPNTITGSIGAFGLFFTARELLNEKLGINLETVSTHQYSDLGTLDRPLSEKEKSLLIASVDEIYNTFKQRVATGRNLSVEYVDSIGQGRVWTGKQALELGLVDVMGGLNDAIEIARDKAGLEDEYRVVFYPELEDPFTRLLNDFAGRQQIALLQKELGEYAEYLKIAEMAKNRKGFQTRLEYDLIID